MNFLPQKILFVLKQRLQYSGNYPEVLSSGLLNSARFVVDMLNDYMPSGNYAKLVQVVDNNSIDHEVAQYQPDIVVIEALWVVPEKFAVLKKLHPNVIWIVRLHSELPFLANEGMAMGWIKRYIDQGILVAFNSKATMLDAESVFGTSPRGLQWSLYLPNYYPVDTKIIPYVLNQKDTVDVGCFGAVRPMKNQLIQAVAALEFAQAEGLRLRFHINATRQDDEQTMPVLKNIRALFRTLGKDYTLVEHGWYDHSQFLTVVRQMDIGLQVSMSETFNIVAADFISENIPVIGSEEIVWLPEYMKARCTGSSSIVAAMTKAFQYKKLFNWVDYPRIKLRRTVTQAKNVWIDTLWSLGASPYFQLTKTKGRHK